MEPLNKVRAKFDDAWSALDKEMKEEVERSAFTDEEKQYIREQILTNLKTSIKNHLGFDL